MELPASVRPPNDFIFETPEGRPFRTVSMEVEVDGDKDQLASVMFQNRIIGTPRQAAYGTHPGDMNPCVAFHKFDNTAKAGELVFDRLNLTVPNHAKGLYHGLVELRKLAKSGVVAHNPNCGGHIHIDASGTGFYDILRLGIYYGHLEEVIHRLAGANATYGHRSLYKGIDYRIMEPGGYSRAIIKGPFKDPSDTFKALRQQPRHSGLNFMFFMSNSCRGCKGRRTIGEKKVNQTQVDEHIRMYHRNYGTKPPKDWLEKVKKQCTSYAGVDLKNCTCKKRKFTVEWRVWNSQGNPRIVYAWIAFMQALHAYTWRPSGAANYEKFDNMEPLEWTENPYKKLTPEVVRAAQDRVDWIFSELPLTDAEKDALAYALQRTPYKAWGKEFFKGLLRYPYKPPPYPNVYNGIPTRAVHDLNGPPVNVEMIREPDAQFGHNPMPPFAVYEDDVEDVPPPAPRPRRRQLDAYTRATTNAYSMNVNDARVILSALEPQEPEEG